MRASRLAVGLADERVLMALGAGSGESSNKAVTSGRSHGRAEDEWSAGPLAETIKE
ncbi:MAG: hypothetical protein OXH96_02495 [Spirochaetaceae bacterium]|nr:hypothetical protein [Spirochaetaceae bacterium]